MSGYEEYVFCAIHQISIDPDKEICQEIDCCCLNKECCWLNEQTIRTTNKED